MPNYTEKAVCHDHFDGSAHCVECKGPCRLIGTEMAYTALVRAVFDNAAFLGIAPPYSMTRQMEDSGVPVQNLWRRAKVTMVKFRSAMEIKK